VSSNASKLACLSIYAPSYLCFTCYREAFTVHGKQLNASRSGDRLSDCENVLSTFMLL